LADIATKVFLRGGTQILRLVGAAINARAEIGDGGVKKDGSNTRLAKICADEESWGISSLADRRFLRQSTPRGLAFSRHEQLRKFDRLIDD
jgi:hypothetical protein